MTYTHYYAKKLILVSRKLSLDFQAHGCLAVLQYTFHILQPNSTVVHT